MELEETQPLNWPNDRQRTRFQDRKTQAAWKLNWSDTLEGLKKELKLLKATSVIVTRNQKDSEDGGVAVWISRKPIDDYGWQDAFGFLGVIPTEKDISQVYMEKVRKIHPDGPTPNRVLFDEFTRHRDNARRWIRGERTVQHETVMGVDVFKEQRHNLNAIKLTLSALRQIERCGSPVMMEQAFRGFAPKLTQGGSSVDPTAAA